MAGGLAGDIVDWAVVGCGWVARDHGAPGIAASGNGRVASACDRDPAALSRFVRSTTYQNS